MVLTPEELLKKEREALHRALLTLTPDQQSLLLRVSGGESFEDLSKEFGISKGAIRVQVFRMRMELHKRIKAEGIDWQAAQLVDDAPTTPPAEEPNPVSPALGPTQTTSSQSPQLEHLRRRLQIHFPVLYAQALEPTLADLREEHSAALAEGRPWKARRVLLQGYGALAAAAVCQLGLSLLGRIAALWKARSPK